MFMPKNGPISQTRYNGGGGAAARIANGMDAQNINRAAMMEDNYRATDGFKNFA